jgi:branched-chain amino acid aminotransferase
VNSPGWIDHNGIFLRAGSPVLTASNRGFRYGDGLFETILVKEGRIRLRDFHFDRLLAGMDRLRLVPPAHFSREQLESRILQLCERNGYAALSRVRLVVYRGDGGLYEFPETRYLIESGPAGDREWNEKGLAIDTFPDGIKACDGLANCKSNNFLLYALAALYAREQGLDDCLVINSHGRIADSTIANLFYIKDGKVYTPPLSEGCVAGVMRRFLLTALPAAGFPVFEQPVTVEELLQAEEVFLTNALKGVRWVQRFRKTEYASTLSRAIYEACIRE